MTFARHQPGGWIEPDPSRAGQKDFGPGVQVGEVFCYAAWSVEAFHIGRKLDEISGHESRGQPKLPQDLNQQP